MKSSFILLLLGLSFSAFAQANDPCQLVGELPPAGPSAQVAQNQVSLFSINDDALLKGLEVSKTRRLRVICEIKQAVKEKYSLIGLKKERLGIDAEQHMQDCARDELAIDSNDRQEFLDRVQKCIAGFQDTHFGGYSRIQRPTVMTAILATNLDGKIVIARQSPLLIAKIKAGDPQTFADLEDVLAPGNEITKINGQPALDEVATLIPYVQGSGPGWGKMLAANSYFVRSFAYPTTRTVTLEIKTQKGELKHIELPWMAQVAPGNYDATVKFKKLGLTFVNELQWKYNPVLRKMEKVDGDLFSVGYNSRKPLFADQSVLTQYNSDDGGPGLRTGEVVQDRDHVFCYMQLLTFMSNKFTKDGTKDAEDYFAPIERFVASCEAKKLPLILDLKNNGGGRADYPAKLLSILAPKGAKYGGSVAAFPATPDMADLFSQEIDPNDTGARVLDDGVDLQTILGALTDAISQGKPYTDLVNWQDVTTSPKVGGYSQKIVALITPGCISACDMTARLLKDSGRAVLIGTTANGTGAGFEGEKDLNSDFIDSQGLLKFQIPNHLFGVAPSAGMGDRLPYDQYKNILMENDPTVADVKYELTPKDMTDQAKSFGQAAVTELFK